MKVANNIFGIGKSVISNRPFRLLLFILLLQLLFVASSYAYDPFPDTNINLELDTPQSFHLSPDNTYTINGYFSWDDITRQHMGSFLILYVKVSFDDPNFDTSGMTVSRGYFPMGISARGPGYIVYSMWAFNPVNPPPPVDPDHPAFTINIPAQPAKSVTISQQALYYNGALTGMGGHGWGTIPVTFIYQAAVPTYDTEIVGSNSPKNNANTDGDPFWTNSGEFFQQVTDLTIPGRGFPFKFTRTYRAQIEFNGPLGYGWDFNYNERLIEKTADNKVLYFNGSARRDELIKLPDSSYTAPVGFYVVLTKQIDGTFKLQERDGTVKIFTSNPFSPGLYTLSSITDRNNNQMTFQYKPTGQLDQITDTLGRVIKVNWGDNGRISELEDFNAPAHRKIKYTIDDKFDLVAVTSPITEDYPDGKTTGYAYSTGFADEKLNHNLLTVTDPKLQTYLTNHYNTDDRIESQDYGEGSFLVSYEAQPDGTLKNTVFDRNDNKRIWYHNTLGNAIRKEVYTVDGIITTNWEYNADGERTRTIFPETNSIEYTFNSANSDRLAQGNLMEIRKKSHLGEPDIFTSFTYESLYNQVETSIDARNNTTTFYFDAQGNVNRILYPTVILPDGSQQIVESNFQYNSYGQVIQATDPEGIITVYEYYDDVTDTRYGYLEKVIRAFNGSDPATQNNTTEYNYDIVGNITGIRDAKLNWTTFEVNNLNQVTKTISRLPFNYEAKFFYDENDNLKEIWKQNIDENGQPDYPEWIKTIYDYDTLDNLNFKQEWISTTELPAITRYFRDANENLKNIIYPENTTVRRDWDELNRIHKMYEGYGENNELVVTKYYDFNNNLRKTTMGNELKGTINYSYDGFDREKTETDALGNYKIMDYDNNGNRTGLASYNSSNEILSETLSSYDELNRCWQIVEKKFNNPGGANSTDVITTYYYDKKGRRWKTIDARGNATITVFDDLDRVKSTTDASGNKVEYGYDQNGNVETMTEAEKDSLGNTVTFITTNKYDNLDRLEWTKDNLNNYTYYKYDSRNNNKFIQDRENKITRKRYDGLNHLIENRYELSPNNVISVKYGLDKNGRLTSLTDANLNVTQYGYDGVNRRTSETFGYGGSNPKTKSYQFGLYGELLSITEPNDVIIDMSQSYSYDNALNLKRKDIIGVEAGTTREDFDYDGLSRMIQASNYEGQTQISNITMKYDSLGNIWQETQQIGSQSAKSVKSTHNELGFRTSLTYPNNRIVNFEPDELSRIRRITQNAELIAQYSYVGPSRMEEKLYGNNARLTVDYDANRRITNYQHNNLLAWQQKYNNKGKPAGWELKPTTFGFGYDHDKEGNRSYEKRQHQNGAGDRYTYDAIYRLVAADYDLPDPTQSPSGTNQPQKIQGWELDGVGNWDTSTTDSQITDYSINNLNQYTAIDGITPQYDFNGNMLFDGRNTLIYDYSNRPVRIENETYLVEVKYDVMGRRIEKKITTKTTLEIETEQYYYDGMQTIEDRDETDNLQAEYIYGNDIDEIIRMKRGGRVIYYHTNAVGSVTHLSNERGEIEESYKYEAYGKVTIYDERGKEKNKSRFKNRYLFTGREYDSETGLYYSRARYYSPTLGRFLQRDPMEDDKLSNLYAYVENNPINYSDPFGTDKNRGQTNATNPHTEPPTPTPHASVAPPTPIYVTTKCDKWGEYSQMASAFADISQQLNRSPNSGRCSLWQISVWRTLRDLANRLRASRGEKENGKFEHWNYDALNMYWLVLHRSVAVWQKGTSLLKGKLFDQYGYVRDVPFPTPIWRRNWDKSRDAPE